MHHSLSIGIDRGGTTIELIALDAEGAEVWRQREVSLQGGYRGTLAVIWDSVLSS